MTRKKKKSRRTSQTDGSKNFQPTRAKREAKKEAVLGTSTAGGCKSSYLQPVPCLLRAA